MAILGTRYLVDKSALARMRLESVQRRLIPLIESKSVATCSIVDLEVLYSARNHEEHSKIRRRRHLSYHHVPLNEETFQRAIEVQGKLAERGRHRLPIQDLIIAAAAELADLTVLHYDSDYDVIAQVTQQSCEWVVPRGSL